MNTPQNTIALGIDPGVGGAIAAIFPSGDITHVNLRDQLEALDWLRALEMQAQLEDWGMHAMIELVTGFVRGGGNMANTSFKLGVSYGHALGCFQSLRISFETIPPATWQRELRVPKIDTYAGRKRALKMLARNMFPRVRVTDSNADAILIAEYCRRQLARRAQ